MCAYRDGFIIPWTAYMLSAAASAASLLKAAAALHHYAYSGVPLREAFLQRGEHFNAELLRLDALEDMQVRHNNVGVALYAPLRTWYFVVVTGTLPRCKR